MRDIGVSEKGQSNVARESLLITSGNQTKHIDPPEFGEVVVRYQNGKAVFIERKEKEKI